METGKGSLRGRMLFSWVSIVLGVLAFFLPLVSVHAPIIGDLSWSTLNIVSDALGSTENNKNESPSFSQIVKRSAQPSGSSTEATEMPLGMRLATFFPFAVLFCYMALVVTVFFILVAYSPRTIAFLSGLGLCSAFYSLIAVFLLEDALKGQMKQSMTGMESNAFSAFGNALLQSISIQPGAGVYLLVGCFALMFIIQYLPALDRLTATD